jgi:hypothetical protein
MPGSTLGIIFDRVWRIIRWPAFGVANVNMFWWAWAEHVQGRMTFALVLVGGTLAVDVAGFVGEWRGVRFGRAAAIGFLLLALGVTAMLIVVPWERLP